MLLTGWTWVGLLCCILYIKKCNLPLVVTLVFCFDAFRCVGAVDLCHSGSLCWSWPCFPLDAPVYMLTWARGAQLRREDGIHIPRFVVRRTLKGHLSLQLSLLMSKVPRGGGAAGCSDLRTPQAPALALPDNQMGQIVSLSATREDRANSLIWSLLMESLEGNFCHFVLPLFPSPLLPNWKFPLLSVTKPSPTGEAEI